MADEEQYNFADDSSLNLLRQYLESIILFDDFQAAKNMVNSLNFLLQSNQDLADSYPNLYEGYKDILIQAKFIALPLLNEDDVLDLIDNYFPRALEIPDYNLASKFVGFMLTLPPEDRDALKEKIRKNLMASEQMVTKEPIVRLGGELNGTIKNWLTDYVINLGADQVDALKVTQYLFSNPDTKRLSNKSREKIRKLFDLFEKLKFSSLSLLGMEEKDIVFFDNAWHVADNGKFVKISSPENDKIVEQAMKIYKARKEQENEINKKIEEEINTALIRSNYVGDLREQKEILEDQELIKQNIMKMPVVSQENDLLSILEKGLDQRDKIKVIAVLRFLAENKIIDKLLTDKKNTGPFIEYLKEKQQPSLVEGFKIQPAAPNYLALFLQYLLQDKLLLNENDAGRVGMQLSNIFKKVGYGKYSNLVYFDMGEGKFRWNV
jgi:hypothetical protein